MRRLLIRPGAIGDCVLALPALNHLLSDYTEIWISAPVVPLISFADSVHSIQSTGLDLFALQDVQPPASLDQRLRSFDSIVSWYGTNRPEFREAMARTGVACTFLSALPPPDYQGNGPGHATDFFCEQVGAARGLIPRISVRRQTHRDSIVIQPFSGSHRKNWPVPCYRELATRLQTRVEWTAGPEEALDGAVRFTNLAELAAWIAASRLYIGNDSGITHLAAATGVPTIALFGPTSPSMWAPRGSNVTVLQHSPISELSIDAVYAAASRLLDS